MSADEGCGARETSSASARAGGATDQGRGRSLAAAPGARRLLLRARAPALSATRGLAADEIWRADERAF